MHHGWVSFVFNGLLIVVAMVISGEHMHFVLLSKRREQVFSHSSKARLNERITAIKNASHNPS
jgi:REP element-mobilizing transposase RayT